VRAVDAFLAKVVGAVLVALLEWLVVQLVRAFVGRLTPA